MGKTPGYTTIPNVGRFETAEIVARIRRFRGRLKFGEIVKELGWPDGRASWLKVRQLCQRNQITTNDADDPDYYTNAIREDERKLREADRRAPEPSVQAALLRAAERAKVALHVEIAKIHHEQAATRPLDKGRPLKWPEPNCAVETRFSNWSRD